MDDTYVYKCITCKKRFNQTEPYQLHCCSNCKQVDEQLTLQIEKRLYTGKCEICKREIRKTRSNMRFCFDCQKEKEKLTYKYSFSEIERWINKKKKRGIPLEELIKRQEWKRVFDDKSWERYLSGKKWDKI